MVPIDPVSGVRGPTGTRPGQPLPGQDFHLLEQQTFHGAPGPGQQSPIDNSQLDPHAGDDAFIDHFAIDECLGGAHATAGTKLDHLAQHDNAMTGSH